MGAFRWLWLAATVDAFGSWLLVTAVPLEVFTRTGSAVSTGLVLAVEAGPALLLGRAAGGLVDRRPRGRLLIGADLLAAAGVALLLFRPAFFLYAGIAVESVAVCVLAPGVQAAVPVVAGDLATANTALAVSRSTWRVLGPLLGAALTAAGRFPVVVVADVLSYLAAAVLTARVRWPVVPAAPAREKGALSVVFGARELRALLVGSCLYWTANAGLTALLVPLVTLRLHAGGPALGYLITGLGVGYLVGSALARPLLRRGPVVIAAGYAAVGACFLVLVTTRSLPVAVAATGLSGLPGAVALAATGHRLQVASPAGLRGRVAGTFRTSDALAAVAGALAAPALVATAGLGPALLVLAAAVPAAAVLLAVSLA